MARRAAVRGARRNGVEVSGADVSFPGGGFAPTRVAVTVRGVARVRTRLGDGRRGGRGERVPVARAGGGGDRAGPKRAVGDAGVRVGRRLRRAAGVPDGQADAPRRGGRVRPDGRRRAPRGRALPVDQQRLPLRRRAGETVRRRTRTRSGSRRPARACTATAPSSTSARPPPIRGCRRTTRRFGFIMALQLGALALRLRRQPARPRAPRALRPGLVGAARGRPRPCARTGCRRSCRRASTIRSPRRRCAGTSR